MKKKTAVILGAGPAGLTAAYELLKRTDVTPIIYEMTDVVGGICRTVEYKGNRLDIGGHRFFSKSDRVMEWWNAMLPLQGAPAKDYRLIEVAYQGKKRKVYLEKGGPDPEKTDDVMLVRNRHTRIYFLRKFFDYPLSANLNSLKNLGFFRLVRITLSYIKSSLFPIKPETSLRDFFINRFGRELYLTFFKSYTEKVWGAPCRSIKAEWGAQRVKGLSLGKSFSHWVKKVTRQHRTGLAQKDIESSLIEKFMYPKFGPGQLWNKVADDIRSRGCRIETQHVLSRLEGANGALTRVILKNLKDGSETAVEADYVFSTVPVKELIEAFGPLAPLSVSEVSKNLIYRDFVTVGVLLTRLKIKNETDEKTLNNIPLDNWIYIQERDVKVGRIQIFNNWSPYLVKNLDQIWIGMEYFCNEGDDLWLKPDEEFKKFAVAELEKLSLANASDVLDTTLVRMKKAYPAYFGAYEDFDKIRLFTDTWENLFLIGRNGMHRYNNQDHSMLTAMVAVDNIQKGIASKDNIWAVNTEQTYQEEK